MSASSRVTLSVLVAGLLSAVPPAALSDIKCWTNKDGVKECGNVVPPEYSQQEYRELNKQGIVVEERDRAKTSAELEAERKAEADKAAEERREREQASRDRVLLDTFASEDDVVLTRDGKIQGIESQIKLAEGHIAKLDENLNSLIGEAADLERKGQLPPEALNKDLENVRRQIEKQKAFIEGKRAEQDSVRAQFDGYIQRFRELKASESAAASTK